MLKRKEDEGATALVRVCLPLPTDGRQNRSSFRTSHPPNYTNEMDQRARLAIFLPALLLLAPQRRHPFSFLEANPSSSDTECISCTTHPPNYPHSIICVYVTSEILGLNALRVARSPLCVAYHFAPPTCPTTLNQPDCVYVTSEILRVRSHSPAHTQY